MLADKLLSLYDVKVFLPPLIYKSFDPRSARQQYTVIGERLVRELRGEPCSEVEQISADKNLSKWGEAFSHPIHLLSHMEQAVSTYISLLGENFVKKDSIPMA